MSPPHVVLVPMPTQGHLNPFASLAHFLAASGISVTLVHSARSHSLLSSSSSSSSSSSAPLQPPPPPHLQASIRIEVMPDLMSSASSADAQPRLTFDSFHASLPIMCKGLDRILQTLMQQAHSPCCLIHDALLPWCHDLAVKFQLPRIVVWTASASVFSVGFHIPELLARGYIPAIADQESPKKTVDFIPGLPPICVADLPTSMTAAEGLQSPRFKLITSAFEHSKSADRILVNSMYELESNVVEALKTQAGLRIDSVGPLFMMSSIFATGSLYPSLLQEDNSCLAWLDQQHESSVLYISFGSIAALEEDVFQELAHGVETSGENFLWVVRPDARADKETMTPEELLPEGFLERTKGRGLVIPWAPQLAVLGHPSVGAFLTHCGWNSSLESLSNGVPMLGFPQRAEQNTNCMFIVHEWGVGLPLIESNAHKLERTHVQRAVNAIMKGVEGAEVQKRALEWREITHKALQGTSKSNLQKLVDDLKNGHVKISESL